MRLRLLGFILLIGGPITVHAQLIHDMIHEEVVLTAPNVTLTGKHASVSVHSQTLSNDFTGIALQGFTDSDSLSGFIRFFSPQGWERWHPLYIVRSATDEAFLAAYRDDHVINATKFELRFQLDADASLLILNAGTFDQRLDQGEEMDQLSQKAEKKNDFLIRAPNIRRRTEWGAHPFRGSPIPLNRPSYDYMTLHHTAGFAATTLSEGLEQVRRIQLFHQNGRGWSDIGYQFLMDQEGRLYQGRPFLRESDPFDQGPQLVQGAHAGGANRGNIGISLMGCFHPPEGAGCRNELTPFATDSLIATFGFLSERYNVSPDDMRGHRDFNNTACPGDNNYQNLPDFMLRVEDLLLRGNMRLGEGAIIARLSQSGIVRLRWSFTVDNGIDEFYVQRHAEDGNPIEIIRGEGAMDGSISDAPSVGLHIYELVAQNQSGAQQRLATAEIFVEPRITNILVQSFPNPTSSQATIRYFLESDPGLVSVNLFDLTGKIVLTGEQQFREPGEWYVTTLDTSSLPGGVYLYRILVAGFSSTVYKESKPLIVLR